MRTACHIIIAAATAWAALVLWEARADACGCLSPPVPVDDEEFAVNQQAEQIIFEVEEAHVSAHVLIKYAGAPERFAWILPVPNLPELSLSSTAAFGLLDRATAPQVTVQPRNLCPQSGYACRYHPAPECGDPNPDPDPGGYADAGAAIPDAGGATPPPVDVIDRQVVGSYDTVIFSAGDAAAAVAWLNAEGFIVNQTMSPFMQPYADAGMLFVAAKLVAGADVSEIRPLRVRYGGTTPMIPLELTAVAAEPHMTITAYIYGDAIYRPMDQPLVTIDPDRISRDASGRANYPMVLSRTIDDLGGDGFVAEYAGPPALPDFDQGTGCCTSGWDICGVEFDGICSCPGTDFDADDCAREAPELVEGLQLLDRLATSHGMLTRLTTRLSPEEMTFDPMFEPATGWIGPNGRLGLTGSVDSLEACTADILEPWRYDAIVAQQDCSTLYCGSGECATTATGAGCICGPGTVARLFTELDGETSVTCVPDSAPVDLAAGGLTLPDPCAGVSCGAGRCVAVGGFPTCDCDPDTAAEVGSFKRTPVCSPARAHTASPGAQDFTAGVSEIPVCAPAPPSCGEFGWLEPVEVARPGVQCSSSEPAPGDLAIPRAPTCGDLGLPSPSDGCTGCRTAGGSGLGTGFLGLLVALALVRRRRLG
jgi:MYXO-CTERM domain-containing protein